MAYGIVNVGQMPGDGWVDGASITNVNAQNIKSGVYTIDLETLTPTEQSYLPSSIVQAGEGTATFISMGTDGCLIQYIVADTMTLNDKQVYMRKSHVSGTSYSEWEVITDEEISITVVDNLTSTSTTDALSANQGRVLKDLLDAIQDAIDEMITKIGVVPSQSGSLTYNGTAQTPSWNNYDSNALTIDGTQSATDAGTYQVTFTPKKGYKWEDDTTSAKTVNWTIDRANVAVPSQSGSLTYTGSAQSPTWSNYDSNKLTLGGTTTGTNSGSYNATFTPKANYQFNDGMTGAKTVTWTIAKAAGSLTLNKSSLTLGIASTMTDTITVTRAGNGTISAVSGNTEVATVSVSGTTITVTAVDSGSTNITVACGVGTNHTAPANKTVNVTVQMANSILAENDPATIKAAAQSGQAKNLWSVGDKAPIAINGTVGALAINGTYYAIVLGFDHNANVEGNNSIHFQIGKDASNKDVAFVDSNYNTAGSSAGFRMNVSNTNSGGWSNSYMRGTICPAFLSALPEDWKNIIVTCAKYSDNTGGTGDTESKVTQTQDKIWLLAEFEVYGKRMFTNSAEQNYQEQYDYYKNGNSKVRYKHNDTSTECLWWLRSVKSNSSSSSSSFFCNVNTDGNRADKSLGFAPGFKVA